jgi:hypothetical protein
VHLFLSALFKLAAAMNPSPISKAAFNEHKLLGESTSLILVHVVRQGIGVTFHMEGGFSVDCRDPIFGA